MNIQPKPKSIVRAILRVKAAISAVAKSETNEHGRYKFASTDAVYAMVTHKMAEAGLTIDVLELEPTEIVRVEIDDKDRSGAVIGKKTQQWGKFRFGFFYSTEDDSWFDQRASRTLYIQITGPQTFQAAQSYVDKAYLRSLFKMPTGDHDLDALPQGDTEEDQMALNGNGKPKVVRKSAAQSKRDGTTQVYNEINEKITKSRDANQCKEVWLLYGDDLRNMARRWFDMLCEDFTVRMKEHGEPVDLDADGWPILETQEAA